MEPEKGKPYMIQLFGTDNVSMGKYKFVIAASKVADLKDKVHEKLVGKKQLRTQQKIIIKDFDDFQLGSDDEVDDVVADCKLKVYIEKDPSAITQKVEDKPSINTQQQPVIQPIPQPTQIIPIQSQNTLPQNIAGIDTPIIDLTNCKFPSVAQDHPKNKTFTFFCPQIRKSPFTLDAQLVSFLTFYEFSHVIVKKFNIDPTLKAIIYSQQGQPLLFNLDLIHRKMPKLDFTRNYTIVFTATKTLSDVVPHEPMEDKDNLIPLKINYKINNGNQEIFTIDIGSNNHLAVLKYKIFKETAIHPANQIIKFANNPLTNDAETLSAYNLTIGSILQLNFKVISNLIPGSYADKFYYKDVQLIHPQEQQSYRILKTHLLVFANHLSKDDKLRFLAFLRYYTSNQSLVCAFRAMFNSQFLSQAHRIALEQGLYTTLWHYLKACSPTPQTQAKQLFTHIRDLFGYIFQALSSINITFQQLQEVSQTIMIENTCTLTTKLIKIPSLIKLDTQSTVIVDRNELMEQIDKGYSFPLLKKPVKTNIFDDYQLLENFDIFKFNQMDLSGTNITMAYGVKKVNKNIEFKLPAVAESAKYQGNLATKYATLKIHEPIQAKNKTQIYIIVRNKEKSLRVFVGRNKDINKPHILFDVISGKEEAVSLDLLSAAGKTQNLEEAVDLKDLKPVITREPKQAIVVLFDISGSMGGRFFNQPDLKRIGACKLFFQALAYRTIAYSFQHVVSLIFFDYAIEVQCDFTEAIYDFNRLIAGANPRGSTKLYDSIIKGVEQLLAFKKRYPECILRILALTDGEDTASQASILDAAKAVIQNNILLDSFAVGASCEGLKTITLATGGKCYLTGNMDESLKLFEQETVLSVRSRKVQPMILGTSEQQIKACLQKVKYKPFDLGNDIHEFKLPEIKGPSLSSADVVRKYQTEQGQKKISGNASLKRITKEIQLYEDNPHPFIAIFPCQNINIWKILLVGPKETPYQNGLFLLYASFPGEYPFRAPEVRFITPIYHCNMNQQGRICHSVFDRNYSPALTFRHIMDCVYGLILTPEPDDPLDNVIASYYLSEYPTYVKNAKQATLKKASNTTQEIVEQIFGKIADDIEKQKKVEEITKWIQKAKSFN